MSTRILDRGDFTWEGWMVEICGLDYDEYIAHPEILTIKVLEDHLYEIIERLEELKKTVDHPPYFGKGMFGEPIYGERLYSLDYAHLVYQILALLILETGSFLPDKVKEEVLKSTTWEFDKRWGWSPDIINDRKFYLKQFRKIIRRYTPGVPNNRDFIYYIPNISHLREEIIGIDTFYNYLNSSYSFKKLIKAMSLKRLYLDCCNLNQIPREVFMCGNLEELSLSSNYLTQIPKEICKLTSLKKLVLSHNYIKIIPPDINNLRLLELLWIDDNQLISFPKSILTLPSLRELDISKNPLQEDYSLFIPSNLNVKKSDH